MWILVDILVDITRSAGENVGLSEGVDLIRITTQVLGGIGRIYVYIYIYYLYLYIVTRNPCDGQIYIFVAQQASRFMRLDFATGVK